MSVQENIDVIAHINCKGEIFPLYMKIDNQRYKVIKIKRIIRGITSTCNVFAWLYEVICDDQKMHRLFYKHDEKIWFIEGMHVTKNPFETYTHDQIIEDNLYIDDNIKEESF